MAFGHVRALNDDAIGVLQVLLEGGGPATTERSSQTGNGGAVSNTRLVLDLDRAQGREQFLDQVVLFVVERRAAEPGDGERAPQHTSLVVVVLPARATRLDDPV